MHEKAGTIAAELASASNGFVAHLVCVSQTGAIARRDFEQSDCAQAVEDMSVMSVACIQSTTEPPAMTWSAGVTAGFDYRMGPRATNGGVLFAIRWPASPLSLSFNPTYADTGTVQANHSPEVPLRFRLGGMRIEGCFFEPRLGRYVSFPLCVALAGGYLQARFEQPTRPPLDTGWATAGLAARARTVFGGFFVQLEPTIDVYLAARRITGESNEVPATPVRHDIPMLSGGVLLSVGYTGGHF